MQAHSPGNPLIHWSPPADAADRHQFFACREGAQQIKIDLVDEGGYVANSSLYLNTNCTPGGVTGPALISGNTIPASNPTPQQLNQDFTFQYRQRPDDRFRVRLERRSVCRVADDRSKWRQSPGRRFGP